MELPNSEAHDVLIFFERGGVISFLDEINLPECTFAESSNHLEIIDCFFVNFNNFQLFCGLIGHLAFQVL